MSVLYRIKDWSDHYENNRTRELKSMQWVPIPAKLDGDGYTELLDHKNGPGHYGVWVGCVIVASRCDPRGTLLRGTKKPFCASSLGRVLRMPESLIKEALERFVSIGWMETETVEDKGTYGNTAGASQEGAVKSQEGALNGMERKKEGKEWNEVAHRGELPPVLDVPEFVSAWSDWIVFRRKKRKPVSETAAVEQLADLARYGPSVAVQAIRESIKNDYQGLFPEKIKNANRYTQSAGQQYIPGSELGPV